MDKIREIIKKNGLLILLGVIIGVLVLYLILQRGGVIQKNTIGSPFMQIYDFSITVPSSVTGFSDEVPVLEAEIFESEEVIEFAQNLSDYEINPEFEDDSLMWFENKHRGNFNKSSGLVSIFFDDGTKIDAELDGLLKSENAESYLKDFKEEYLGNLPAMEIDEIYENEGSIYISGFYVFDEYPEVFVSSRYLDDYAFEVEFSEFGNLNKISLLMIKDVKVYEKLPTMNSSEISKYVGLSSFPKAIEYEVISDEYDDLAGSVKAGAEPVSADFEEYSVLWIYVGGDDYSYIVPVYKLTGNGIIQDPFDETYEANMEMYFCAVDPEYVRARESESQEINFEQDLSEERFIEDSETEGDEPDRYLFDPVGGQPEGL